MDYQLRDYQRKIANGEGDVHEYFHLLNRAGQLGPYIAQNTNTYQAQMVQKHLLNFRSANFFPVINDWDSRKPALQAAHWLVSNNLADRVMVVTSAASLPAWVELIQSLFPIPSYLNISGRNWRESIPYLFQNIDKIKIASITYGGLTSLRYRPITGITKCWPYVPENIRDSNKYPLLQWPVIIADEIQNIKNHDSQRHNSLVTFSHLANARWRIALGNPITNSLLDLWSIYQFIDPTFFNMSRYAFRDTYMIASPTTYKSTWRNWQPNPKMIPHLIKKLEDSAVFSPNNIRQSDH